MEGNKNLVIVESPGKVKKIQDYLGKEYLVKASVGHIRDLPEHQEGIKREELPGGGMRFTPGYVVPPDKEKVVSALAAAAPVKRPSASVNARSVSRLCAPNSISSAAISSPPRF